MTYCCEKCKIPREEKAFYTHRDGIQKYPICKECLKSFVNDEDPDTYLPILEWLNMPYFKDEWWKIKERCIQLFGESRTGISTLGRYLAKMKLCSFRSWTWKDNRKIEEIYQTKRTDNFRYMLARKLGDA